jgi:hypothetical protein
MQRARMAELTTSQALSPARAPMSSGPSAATPKQRQRATKMWRRWCAPSSETHVGDDRCRRWILEMSHMTRIMDGDPTAEARAWPMLRTGGGGSSRTTTSQATTSTSRKGKKSIKFQHQFWVREIDSQQV